MANPKSLMEFIVEEIDKALLPAATTTGVEIYMRGLENYERHHFERELVRKRRELMRSAPPLARESEVIEDFSADG
jgi:hypothetical protein